MNTERTELTVEGPFLAAVEEIETSVAGLAVNGLLLPLSARRTYITDHEDRKFTLDTEYEFEADGRQVVVTVGRPTTPRSSANSVQVLVNGEIDYEGAGRNTEAVSGAGFAFELLNVVTERHGVDSPLTDEVIRLAVELL